MSSDSSKTNEMGDSNLTNLSRRDTTQMGDHVDSKTAQGRSCDASHSSTNTANSDFYKGNKDPQTIEKVKQNMEQQQDPSSKKPEEKK
ncbi:unnamed protein product [Didymodactylos carnosus]|uniref:Uncharacterized protein n=1 Tax=Didymodactylos carnosus TaxID=1234261 RepID=A0A816BGF7_9BILA|nr:unnamed protein product [Didymodactylos carnosus]CAF1610490.1 unnamed protein product [Didymodactylos carnosus]CAF4358161.1 unnamed protein product [Didymodactylos carnosus]CAF4493279.1 unnamed protein product [Didymodactylos carnosus]